MKERQIKAHMRAAQVYADLSYCKRLKVGCVIVKDNRIISIGYNGTPAGEDNTCEDQDGNTIPSVVHAEENAIHKLERSPETGEATLFSTIAPCLNCARLIWKPLLTKVNITHVVYRDPYRSDDGVKYLLDHGITVTQLPR